MMDIFVTNVIVLDGDIIGRDVRKSFYSLPICGIFLILFTPYYVQAGEFEFDRHDWPETYENVPGALECWYDGADDGLDHPFDQDRHKECIFDVPEGGAVTGKPYYEAFIRACKSVEGNTEETCERFTDA